jgi:putative ABC transport system permease protein
MIRHYLKLIWNRKRSNLLVMLEIFMAFLVVFAVVTLGVYFWNNYRQPLGFDYENVWNVSVSTPMARDGSPVADADSELQTARQLVAAMRAFAEVESVAGVDSSPYGFSNWESASTINGWRLEYGVTQATDDYLSVARLDLTEGRWFSREDNGASWASVVINERMAREIFGDRPAVGNNVPQEPSRDGTVEPQMRIVGVVREYRQDGEFSRPKNYLFRRHPLDGGQVDQTVFRRAPHNFVLRLRPGTTAAFEERLVNGLQAVARDWSFEVKPMDQMRETRFRVTLGPLVAAAVVSVFLLLMVGMGLTGVLWQTVTQRTREMGLRRAKGATIGHIRMQILGELVMMTSVALLAGVLLVIQFPLLRLLTSVPAGVYAGSLVISATAIYLLTVACAWYPSRMATGIPPAVALRYE